MERWAQEGDFNVNFICICVNGDSTALPTAKDFATRYRMTAAFNGYISDQASLPSWGQLGCQGLILVDSKGNFITKRSASFLQEGEKAWRKVEKKLFELGCYQGERKAEDFGEPPLRFSVNTKVECRCGRALWLPGQVIAERMFAMGREMPYQVRLDDGRLIFAPVDNDQVIRKVISNSELEIESVGVEEMDQEHEGCMDALLRLRAKRSEEHLRKVHSVLRKHFEHEEELFAASGFGNHGTALSGTKSHCDDHARILSEIEAQIGSAIKKEFVVNLMARVVTHTRDYDSKYAGKISTKI